MFATYSNEDYDRRNEDVDPMAASAEYELEKRVERLDLFPVELEKGIRTKPCFFLTSPVFIQILSVKSALYFGHINNSKHLLYFDLPEASLHLAKKENTKNPQM